VDIYFDPVTKIDFKHAIASALKEYAYAIEAQMIFEIYSALINEVIDVEMNPGSNFKDMVRFNEEYAAGAKSKIIPNAVQHNVPAWTIFAMFFIVIPLAGNIIKERESGMALRLRTMPGSNLPVILGKATVYFVVGLFQAFFMIMIGVAVMPLFGMPALIIEGGTLTLLLIAISVSLAASGYGVLIGTIATSQEQSSIFGSISVVILAAIGGVWVPTFMMSDLMVSLSKISPLNWGLNAFYEVFLRNAGVSEVMLNIVLLLAFFVVCIAISWIYNRLKTN
jgi:ABC-2 type transport system permease protein